MTVLSARGLSKSFGGLVVVGDVSLDVAAGQIVGLIGPNGAGKTTLFSLLTGFMRPDGGTVSLGGRPITTLSAVSRARLGIARTFQVPREFRHLSVRDNLAVAAPRQLGDNLLRIFLSPSRVRRQQGEIAAAVEALIDFLNLRRVVDEPAGTLSGGQKKLLELGRALMLEPRLLLLDEPFAGVNPVLIEEICERLQQLRDRGIGLLVVEHNLPALSSLASRVYVMDQGCVIASGDPKGALRDPRVRLAYVGAAA